MKHFIRILAAILAITFAIPQAAIAASSNITHVSPYTLLKRFTRSSKKRRATKRKSRRVSKSRSRKLSKSRRNARARARTARARAKARRIARAKSKRAKALRVAAAKRAALYSRKVVRYRSREKPGTIIIETRTRHLYHIFGQWQGHPIWGCSRQTRLFMERNFAHSPQGEMANLDSAQGNDQTQTVSSQI